DQRCIRRNDSTAAASSVAQLRRDPKLPLAAHFHAGYAFVPTFNHLTSTQRKTEWLPAIDRAVELLAIGEPSGVMHLYSFSRLCCGSSAYRYIPIFKPGRRALGLAGDLRWRRITLPERRCHS